jgi:carboxyl-terminal processing protease
MKKKNIFKILYPTLITTFFIIFITFVYSYDWQTKLKLFSSSELGLLNRVVKLINQNYVEPSKIVFDEMFESALRNAEKRIPEIIVSKTNKKLTIKIIKESKTYDLNIKSDSDLFKSLKDAYYFIKAKLPTPEEDLEFYLADGLTEALDPNSNVLSKEFYKEMTMNTQGEFEGIGIVITMKDGALTVVSPIEDTPAFKQGLKANDKITHINDEASDSMTLNEAVNKIRGPKGTDVALKITREGITEPKLFKITRQKILIKSIEAKKLEKDIGYIKIKNFERHTAQDLVTNINNFKHINGLILDMRNNPGGLLDQAEEVSDLFLDEGVIVTRVIGADNHVKHNEVAKKEDTMEKFPLVVLVNEGSASASEIVAGAIKNNNRGVIIGARTFGKGTVQTIYGLPNDMALKLTVEKYLTPGNKSIQDIGITPDIELIPTIVSSEINILYKEEHKTINDYLFPKSYKNKFTTNHISEYPLISLKYVYDEKDETKDENKKDFPVIFATKLLNKIHIQDREKFLTEVKKEEATIKKELEQELIKNLEANKIDWAYGKNPDKKDLNIDAIYNKEIQAGSESTLALKVTNKGNKPLYRIWAILNSDNVNFDQREFIFGKISQKESITREIKIKLPEDEPSSIAELNFNFYDDKKQKLKNITQEIKIKETKYPRFTFDYILDDKQGNSNKKIDLGELIDVIVSIKNIGEGNAKNLLAILRNPKEEGIIIK